jgi:hypothetical protein
VRSGFAARHHRPRDHGLPLGFILFLPQEEVGRPALVLPGAYSSAVVSVDRGERAPEGFLVNIGRETLAVFSAAGPHAAPRVGLCATRGRRCNRRVSQRDMREVNVSSVRTYRQIGAPATNQLKRRSMMFRTKRQPAPPLMTGLMSKVKTLFQQPEGDDEDHAEGQEAGRGK